MVDMTNFFDRPQNEKRSPRPKQAEIIPEQCPAPQNSPTHTHQRAQCQQHYLPSHIEMKFGGFSQIKEEYPIDGQLVSEGSHPG